MASEVACPHCGTSLPTGTPKCPICRRALPASPDASRHVGHLAISIGAVAAVVAGACLCERIVRLSSLRPGADQTLAATAEVITKAYEQSLTMTEAIFFGLLLIASL